MLIILDSFGVEIERVGLDEPTLKPVDQDIDWSTVPELQIAETTLPSVDGFEEPLEQEQRDRN